MTAAFLICVAQKTVFYDTSDPEAMALVERRSQCHLSVAKLLREYPDIPDVRVSLVSVMQRLAEAQR